jgi:hypothetical protein
METAARVGGLFILREWLTSKALASWKRFRGKAKALAASFQDNADDIVHVFGTVLVIL